MLSYKYVQKPFVHELNPHIDVSQKPLSIENALQAVSVEPLRLGGKLTVSAFPVIQKGTPVQKQPIPFNFEVRFSMKVVIIQEFFRWMKCVMPSKPLNAAECCMQTFN